MKCIAITGGIACGKSLVGRYLRARGIPVADADEMAHAALGRGQPAFMRVLRTFGRKMLGPGGEIDRRRLARFVFADGERLGRLNRIVHPEVRRAVRRWLAFQKRLGSGAAAVDVPLLFEAGMASGWDAVVCVLSSPARQSARAGRRGWSRRELGLRMRAQWPVDRKAGLTDFVIVNNGTKASMYEQTRRVVGSILET